MTAKKKHPKTHTTPIAKRRNAERKASRRKMEKVGRVKKGDGKDVHHKNHNTADQRNQNLGVTSASKNRSMNQKK